MTDQKEFLTVEPLRVDDFIKKNNLKEITNPIFFSNNNVPTSDGLLSNEIFGISKEERSTTFAYIDLHQKFINPIFFKIWDKMDRKLINCIYGNGTYSFGPDGKLVDDPEGGTGLDFLVKNFDPSKIIKNKSLQRTANIKFMVEYKDRIFIDKYIVIPAFYRDVNTTDRYVGVGDVNKLYNSLLIAANSIKEYDEYGLTIFNSVKGRMQNIMVQLFEYFTADTVAGKLGLLRRAAISKTTDYSSRLVITAPDLKVENIDDFITDVDHAAIPLASLISNFYPYIMAYVKQFFANEFQNNYVRDIILPSGKTGKVRLKDYRVAFTDDVLHDELDRFIHGFSDRFRAIVLPLEKNPYKLENTKITFHGYTVSPEKIKEKRKNNLIPEGLQAIVDRPMTWCDLLYIAAVEVTADKTVLITRYPIDSYYNQFPQLINVSSTYKTEPMVINNKLYKHYPYIRLKDIGTNTSNLFIDTLRLSNVYLGSIGGDYDGDQVSCKSIYSIEANKELRDNINSKKHFIGLSGQNIMKTTNEGAMALYSLTESVDEAKVFTEPEF